MQHILFHPLSNTTSRKYERLTNRQRSDRRTEKWVTYAHTERLTESDIRTSTDTETATLNNKDKETIWQTRPNHKMCRNWEVKGLTHKQIFYLHIFQPTVSFQHVLWVKLQQQPENIITRLTFNYKNIIHDTKNRFLLIIKKENF